MKKIAFIFLSFSLVLQSFAFGFLFPIKIVHAGTLSTSIFPSSISGMSLVKSAVQAPHGCYAGVAGYGAQEFVAAFYQSADGKGLAANVGKYNTSGSAENIAKSCTAELKAQVGTSASWAGTKNTTVSGYKAIYDIGSAPGQGYAGIIHVIVNEYLIALTIIGGSSVSESDLKSTSAVLVARLSQASPSPTPTPPPEPSKKDNGQYCRNSSECRSGYCYNNICCASGKECCTQDNHCREAFYCDTSAYCCVQKKAKSSSCKVDSECQSNYCGAAGSSLVCCTKGPMGMCCKTQGDCGVGEYCFDYGCRAQEQDGSQCGYDYECKSGYCDGGKCKTRPREKEKLSLGYFCKKGSDCYSGNCSNGICCDKGKLCCTINSECEKDKGEWWQCKAGFCVENVEGKRIAEQEKKRKDGYCAPDESCYTPDCEYSVRCGIEGACEFGGSDAHACVGCIASIASELNIVIKVVDIIQGIGCDVLGNLIGGLLSQSVDKVYSAAVSMIYVAIDIGLELNKAVALLVKVIGCIDGYFGLSKTFLIQVAYSLIDAVSGVTGNDTAVVALQSPAGLIVKDAKGRSTGISAAGITHSELPNSVFIQFPKADLKLVFLTDTGGKKYEVITRATAPGTINVNVARSDGKTIEKIAFDNINQDSETQTDLSFNTKVGSGTENMSIPLKEGGMISKTGQLSIEKIDETKVPEKFKAKRLSELNIFGGFSVPKILKILIVLIVLIFGVNLIRRKREFILRIFKKRKEGLAEKLGVKKEERLRTRKSIIVNIIKFIIYFNLGSLAILVAVNTTNNFGPRVLIFTIPLIAAGAAALYLAVKLVKDRKLSLKHLAVAILVLFIIGAIIFLLLFFSQAVSR